MRELITAEEYKTAKKISKTDQDDQLQIIIPAVSNLIQAYVGFEFVEADEVIEEIVPSYLTDVVQIQGYPVNPNVTPTIEEIEPLTGAYDSTVIYPSIAETGYKYNPITNSFTRNVGYWGTVEITYETGFAEIPADIKLAAIHLAEYYLKEQYIQQKNVMGINATYVTKDKIPAHIKLLLDEYKIDL